MAAGKYGQPSVDQANSRAVFVTDSEGNPTSASVGVTSSLNSSVTPLIALAAFTGTFEDVTGFSSISVIAYADVSAQSLVVQWSAAGTAVDYTDTATDVNNAGNVASFVGPVRAKYARVVFTNSDVGAQGTFHLQTVYKPTGSDRHVVVDMAPSTSVTNTGTFAVQATIAAGSAVIGHVIVDSGTITAITNALPAGANVIGHVVVDSAPITAVTNIGLTDLDAAIGTTDGTTIPTKAVLIGGRSIDSTSVFEELPIGSLGRSVLVEPIFLSTTDQRMLRELMLLRQAFQDWTGTDPREDPDTLKVN